MAEPTNPNKDIEVAQPPDDSVSAMEFSPATMKQTFLVAGSWDNSVRCWEVEPSGQVIPKSVQSMAMPILDVCWSGDGTRVFMASCDKQVKCWDLGSNQTMQVAAHDAPIRTCHWVESPSYTCIMTGSWDRTLKFWDLRMAAPIKIINLPERAYCADVAYPIAIVGTASKGVVLCRLDGTPSVYKCTTSPLKHQHRCIALLKDKITQAPIGFGLGSTEGRAAIFYNFKPLTQRDYFVFKCHRRNILGVQHIQDIYAVNDIKFHPVHGTLATAGSDATFAFWDTASRSRLMASEIFDQPITKCCFNSNGQIFAYSIGYDWSKGHAYNDPTKKPQIFLRSCFEQLRPKRSTED